MKEVITSMYAKYTACLFDVMNTYPDLLDELKLSTEEKTNTFISMLRARWDIYEVGAETIPLFKKYMIDTFNTWKNYYEEMIEAYEKKIDYLDGTLITHTETIVSNGENIQSEDNLTTYIDLPNRTNPQNEYASNKTKNNNSNNSKSNNNSTINYEDKNNRDIIKLKDEYMKQLRNVYLEFVEKFSENFIHYFGTEVNL